MSKDSGAKEDTITLTQSQMTNIIATAVETALKARESTMGVLPASASQEARSNAAQGIPTPDRTPHAEELWPCLNEENGAKFNAVVVKSRTFPEGRVVDLRDYRYPGDIVRRVPEGLLKGTPVLGDPSMPGKAGIPLQLLQWRAENYDMADRRQFVGKSAKRLPRVGDPVEVKFEEVTRTFTQ